MFTHFYNSSVRKTVVAFGSLFNDIVIARSDSSGAEVERIRVPLSYGPKEKFLTRLNNYNSLSDSAKAEITLPRIGFEITDVSYDPSRKRNTLSKSRQSTQTGAGSTLDYAFAEVPYNFNFAVSAFTRNMDDGLQIMEQILPYFTPEFTVSINFTTLYDKLDVPIILNNVSIVEDYEGDFDSRRNIQINFDFTAKSFCFGPTKNSSVIRQTKTVFFNDGLNDWIYGPTGATSQGATGAFSRVDVGLSGATGTVSGYTAETNIYVRGATGYTAGPPIDAEGNTY